VRVAYEIDAMRTDGKASLTFWLTVGKEERDHATHPSLFDTAEIARRVAYSMINNYADDPPALLEFVRIARKARGLID
jgi:hypothetical protein